MTLFYVSAAAYKPLTSKGGIHVFQFIYFFSSFWGQFGERLPAASLLHPAPVWLLKHLQHSTSRHPAPQPQPLCDLCLDTRLSNPVHVVWCRA